jgi:FlaG/FlaF family flagellin (archaellin)
MRYMVITQRATDKQLFVSYTEDLSINPSSILWYEIGAGWVDEGGKAHPMDILSVTEIVVSPSNFSPADVTLSLRNNDCYASVDEDILEDDNYAEEATHLLTYNPNGGSCASYREKVGVKVTNNHSSRRYDVVFHFYSHDPTETSWGMDYRDTYGLISLNPGESRELKFASGWTHLDLKAVRVTTPWLKYSSEPDPSYLSSTITGDECY